jgi:Spondin_N
MPKVLIGFRGWLVGIAVLAAGMFCSAANFQKLQVTITNITGGQIFTPIMVVTHQSNVKLFTLGQPASQGLARLAEAGDNSQIESNLKANPDVLDIADSGATLTPGQSVTLTLKVSERFDHLSVAAMLIPTNDAFFAVNNASVSNIVDRDEDKNGKEELTLYAPAYDAGTKKDDELCAHIPGLPDPCRGTGFVPEITGPNFVFIHSGIHGIGDLKPADWDWKNPVTKITVTRLGDSH